MTTLEKRVKQFTSRRGLTAKKLSCKQITGYCITAANYEEYSKITAALERCPTLCYQKAGRSDGGYFITIFDVLQFIAWQKFERQKIALVDVFNTALKANGGDQNAAKAAQREKAVQWNAVEAFNAIYA